MLTQVSNPLGRLWEVDAAASGGLTTRFLYDGDALVAEYDDIGNLNHRYVHGVGTDVPAIWYEGAGVNDATCLQLFANWQGSITTIMKGDESGEMVAINGYDSYGIANETNIGRFQYTGQITIPELGLYHYKARVYSPTLGRFLQTDPIGYEGGINIYAYADNDPVNLIDPTGMNCDPKEGSENYTCKVDNNDGGNFSDEEIAALEGSLTATVNYLASLGNKSVTIDVGGKILTVRASELVDSLSKSFIRTTRVGSNERSMASTRGGALTPEYNKLGKSIITVNSNFIAEAEKVGASTRFAGNRRKARGAGLVHMWTHEGIHASKTIERPLFDLYRRNPERYNDEHQTPFFGPVNRLLNF